MKKRRIFVYVVLSSLVGVSWLVHKMYSPGIHTSEGQIITPEQKEDRRRKTNLPTEIFNREVENTVVNMLEGILEGNFDYVVEKASDVSGQGEKILDNYFLQGHWHAWLKALNIEEMTKVKEVFTGYMNNMDAQIKEILGAAHTKDEEATLNAVTNMIKTTCFDCHRKYRKLLVTYRK